MPNMKTKLQPTGGAALPERWEPPEHDAAGTAWLPMIPDYIERSRRALAVMEYVEDATDAEKRAAKLASFARLVEWPVPIQNQATLLRAEALATVARLVDEGQERGEIAVDGRPSKLSDARTVSSFGIPRQRVAEGRALAESGIVERVREQVERDPDKLIPMNDIVKRAMRIQRDATAAMKGEVKAKREAKIKRIPAPDIRLGDFREVLMDVRDVDLVFTDPPYPREYLPLWSDLAAWAAQALKPGALLVAYSGQYHLLEVMNRLSEHLTYMWVGWIQTPGEHASMYTVPVSPTGKPLLFFSNGQPSSRTKSRRFPDQAPQSSSTTHTGDLHKWQQDVVEPLYYIEKLTERGELVVDPFLGSGTFALAAKQIGRRFVGAEVDPGAFETTRKRLS
jgi:hypothetical protein